MIGIVVAIRIDDEDRDSAEEWFRSWMDAAEAVVDFEFLPLVPIDMDPERHVPLRLQEDA